MSGVCKAKDPANCRYHGTNAHQTARKSLLTATSVYEKAVGFTEKEEAFQQLALAQSVYDATDEGFKELRTARMQENNPLLRHKLNTRYLIAKVARQEEKQNGQPTDVIILGEPEMTARLEEAKQLVADGGSDRFYDVLDRYEPALEKQAWERDSRGYKDTYNEMVDELLYEAQQSNWFDETQRKEWEAKVEGKRIGRILDMSLGF